MARHSVRGGGQQGATSVAAAGGGGHVGKASDGWLCYCTRQRVRHALTEGAQASAGHIAPGRQARQRNRGPKPNQQVPGAGRESEKGIGSASMNSQGSTSICTLNLCCMLPAKGEERQGALGTREADAGTGGSPGTVGLGGGGGGHKEEGGYEAGRARAGHARCMRAPHGELVQECRGERGGCMSSVQSSV